MVAVDAGGRIVGVRNAEEFPLGRGAVEQQIYDAAGEEFNINSPKQLGEILFDKLGLPVIIHNRQADQDLYPLLFMFVTSLKNMSDLLNPMVQWVPTELFLGNYEKK